MTKDVTEVAELLRETANNCKEKKENENEDVDEKMHAMQILSK